jgi:hypothetical protein
LIETITCICINHGSHVKKANLKGKKIALGGGGGGQGKKFDLNCFWLKFKKVLPLQILKKANIFIKSV